MSILSVERISHTFGDRWLFKDLTFGLQKGDRVALVGINGTGKSTLLKILSGKTIPIEGKVVKTKDLKIGYLEQEPSFENLTLVSDFIYSIDNDIQQFIKEYDFLIRTEQTSNPRLQELADILTIKDAWNFENNIKTILNRMGIVDLEQPINKLSGGQRKRLSLAKLLIDEPDVYILDEPTNHLDIETIEWLENLLTIGQKTIIFVTHDRYFLDNICTEIKELNEGNLYSYKGNYGYFLEKKAEREISDTASLEKNKNLLRKELEWMRRQPKARGTKSKARIDAFYDLEEKTKSDKRKDSLRLDIKLSRQGNKILELNHINKSFGKHTIVDNFSYIFKKGDRIGLAGKNGSGKSTFLNLITGQELPDSGEIITGETTVFGYYKQGGLNFTEKQRVIDVVKEVAEYITTGKGETITASQLLTHFLFTPEKQYNLVEKLSGGEKKRLQLMRVLIKNPNFLILDEPTNDLDIDTLNVLENFLENYTGVLLLVSHDRFLIDKLTDQLFIFQQEQPIRIYNGNYSDFKLEENPVKKETKTSNTTEPKKDKVKLSFKEKREFEILEQEIAHIEFTIKEKTEQLLSTTDHQLITILSKELEVLNNDLEEKSVRWIELGELI
ncbi:MULTISPECIES: ABC-F family ATP-binding cassette domain-containing protein [Olivibacter]|uniref:ABC-F family ATP-binding cassette domain-containing protein n=1 Tax=Olivibacter TaxID=376469 RepID=UPI001030E797|nr:MULTISPECIES: ABC-F family ATP-binding cassette domain-containing protein [Olivibacter]MDM8177448.1 ABC-F family ATP-binding cassette domain-containing protein [Olivibacter sp. 47]